MNGFIKKKTVLKKAVHNCQYLIEYKTYISSSLKKYTHKIFEVDNVSWKW